MKIFIPEYAKTFMGGGGTFTRNLQQALKGKVDFITDWRKADLYFIPGCTLTTKEEVKEAKKAGKNIVLRIDNIPRNTRNRNTGTSRLKAMSDMADIVVYQSQWAREWIEPFLQKDGPVILNGVDTNIFKPSGAKIEREGTPQYLYSRYNRDENKRWEKAWYSFQRFYYRQPKSHLWIVGRFSDNKRKYNFDFFGGAEDRYSYLGIIDSKHRMAEIYRGADFLLYTYSLDACSNVLIEAKMCGMKILGPTEGDDSAWEILKADKSELTLEAMGRKYLEVFRKAIGE